MLFSDIYQVRRRKSDDWFDPLLNQDTKLFIDPFLLYDGESGIFEGSHNDIINFFNHALKLVAKSGGDERSVHWESALALLRFPEVEEICLGYTALGTRGSGSGRKIAKLLANGLRKAIHLGIKEITHFEEVQILEEGIGADRISDATATLIKSRLIRYTTEICRRHRIPVHPWRTDRASFDTEQGRWRNGQFQLPRNPANGKAVLLAPIRYLRRLPTINADNFWDYCYDNYNEELRRRYGEDIVRNVDKQTIIDLALAEPDFKKEYVKAKERITPTSYDVDADPDGAYQPGVQAYRWAKDHPWEVTPKSDNELAQAVETFIEQFRNFVENERGWMLLWNDNGAPKGESAFQVLFMQTVATYCRANGIDMSPEANVGRGPVDFKMSAGYNARVLAEAKLAKNSRFWHGVETQLPIYLRAEQVTQGFFIVCAYTDDDIQKIRDLERRVSSVNRRLQTNIKSIVVDARKNPPSASVA